MGLDISAVSHLRFVKRMPSPDGLERLEEELSGRGKSLHEVYFLLYANGPHHKRQLEGMKPGLYEYTEGSEHHSFRAGSYSSYNWWRDQLARFAHGVPAEEVWAHPRRYKGKPFVELIDFTDCDGRIGTPVAAKLLADFQAHAGKADDFATSLGEEAEYWLEVYREFTEAFRLAAQDGALMFC